MQEESGRRSPWRWLRSISIASRLAATIVAVSVVSLSIATIVGLGSGRELTDDITDDQLIGLRTSGSFDVVAQMNQWSRVSATLAASPQAPIAVEAFAEAFAALPSPPAGELEEEIEELLTVYGTRYIEPLAEAGIDIAQRDIVPVDTAAISLQHAYGIGSELLAQPSDLDDALDGTDWSEVHRQVNPVYRDVVQRLDLVDLLLVEPDDGLVVYSVQKHPDLGTSLDIGPFSGSVIAKAVDLVRQDPDAGTIVTDLSAYFPNALTPVGAIASPVMEGRDLAGVLVMLYDSRPLTELVTGGGEWESTGFPPTGETFLVHADGTMRTEPRSYIEDASAHLDAALAAESITESERSTIEAAGTTVLTQRAVEETVNAGVDGDTNVRGRPTVTGATALSTAAAVPIEGLDWIIVTEVDQDEAEGGLGDFTQLLIIGASIFVVLVAFAAVAWSTSLLGPIREISDRLGAGDRTTGELVVPDSSPAEFKQLAASFDDMVRGLDEQRTELTTAHSRRIELLRNMLPPGVAERVARGDLESLEEVPKASVIVVVIAGLGSLVRLGDRNANRDLVDRLHGELDDIGRRHGVERIKIVGDAYYAACGHNRPYIDHAPRTVTFAADAQDAVRELGSETPVGLDIVAGVHTGPVMVGMTLESRMVYDVWGPTVSTAHHLARRGRDGQILITDATQALLPDQIETQADPGDGSIWIVSALSVGGRA